MARQKSGARKTSNNTSPTESSELASDAEAVKPTTLRRRVLGGFDRNRVTVPEHDEEVHGPSIVQQHFKDECDINRIVLKYTQTGMVTHLASGQGEYAVAPGFSFTEAMFLVTQAQDQFSQLPAEVRAHFQNDPAQFLDAVNDESRRGEFEELGLVQPRRTQEPVTVRLADPIPQVQEGSESPQGQPGASNSGE